MLTLAPEVCQIHHATFLSIIKCNFLMYGHRPSTIAVEILQPAIVLLQCLPSKSRRNLTHLRWYVSLIGIRTRMLTVTIRRWKFMKTPNLIPISSNDMIQHSSSIISKAFLGVFLIHIDEISKSVFPQLQPIKKSGGLGMILFKPDLSMLEGLVSDGRRFWNGNEKLICLFFFCFSAHFAFPFSAHAVCIVLG